MSTYSLINQKKTDGNKLLAVLVDPDKYDAQKLIPLCESAKVDMLLVGGSLITSGSMEDCIKDIKSKTSIPVLLFPGSVVQVNDNADGILLLSLISGRNPDLLIGNHVQVAYQLKKSTLEVLPTGYMLIDSGKATSASYMSNTQPIPHDKEDIAVATAVAGELLGLKLIYLDGGSGAQQCVSQKMIKAVRQNLSIPLFVGGGIDSPEKAEAVATAGADVVVVGNALEKDVTLIKSIAEAIHAC